MMLFRTLLILMVAASSATGGTPTALVTTQPHTRLTKDCAIIAIRGVDGHEVSLNTKQIKLTPGRHTFYLWIKNANGKFYDTQYLGYSLEANHHYSPAGRFYPKERLKTWLADDDHPGLKAHAF